ncbi:MAG: alpha/beta fold hydrolase [Candidatus Sulfotelmatobacter sp.]
MRRVREPASLPGEFSRRVSTLAASPDSASMGVPVRSAIVAVQNPLTSLADDVAATQRAIALQDGPVILVGHSYGGAIITEAHRSRFHPELQQIVSVDTDTGEFLEPLPHRVEERSSWHLRRWRLVITKLGMARTGNYLALPAGITYHYVVAIVRYRVQA